MYLSKKARLRAHIHDQLCLLSKGSSYSVLLQLLFKEYYEVLSPGSSFISYDQRVSYYTDMVFLSVIDPFSLLYILNQALDFQSFNTLIRLTSPSFFDRCLSFFTLRSTRYFGLNGRTSIIDIYDSNSDIQSAATAAFTYIKQFAKNLLTVAKHIKHSYDTTYSIVVSTDENTILHGTAVNVCAWKDKDSDARVFDYINFTSTDNVVALAYDSSSLTGMSCVNFRHLSYTKGTVFYPLFILLDIWLDLIRIISVIQRTQLDIHDTKYAGHAVADWSCGKTKDDIIHILTELGALKHMYD